MGVGAAVVGAAASVVAAAESEAADVPPGVTEHLHHRQTRGQVK